MMKVGELKELLSKYPDDMEVCATTGAITRPKDARCELRDIVSDGLATPPYTLQQTVLQIRHWNYGQPIGWDHLTPESAKEIGKEFLHVLARMEDFPSKDRFMKNGTTFRTWSDFGGSQDWCYGRNWDPRVIVNLEAKGLIKFVQHGYETGCYITTTGMKKIKPAWKAKRLRIDFASESPPA